MFAKFWQYQQMKNINVLFYYLGIVLLNFTFIDRTLTILLPWLQPQDKSSQSTFTLIIIWGRQRFICWTSICNTVIDLISCGGISCFSRTRQMLRIATLNKRKNSDVWQDVPWSRNILLLVMFLFWGIYITLYLLPMYSYEKYYINMFVSCHNDFIMLARSRICLFFS